jgi:excisionase family DNA binding protein
MDDNTPRKIDLDRYYNSAEEACVALQISRPTLHRRISEGKLRTVKLRWMRLIEKPAQDAAD